MNEMLFPLVSGAADVRTYLGTAPVRFYEFGSAPQASNAAYATWQIVTGTPANVLDGPAPVDFVRVQIDIWAPLASTARLAAAAIRNVLEPYADINSFGLSTHDNETGLRRFSLDATFVLDN